MGGVMVSSELTTTAFCARCGRGLVGGVCPNLCNGRLNGFLAGPPRPVGRGTHSGPSRSRVASVLVVAAGLVATAVAGTALVEAARTRQTLDGSNAALARSTEHQQLLDQQLQDLTAAHEGLRRTVAGLRAELNEAPDSSAVVKAAARSVFTVLTDAGSGSGFVVTNRGGRAQMVTNFHVVAAGYLDGDRTVSVQRGDVKYRGRVVEVSEGNDLAVIEVHRRLPSLPIADRRPAVGDALLVLGSPLGLGGTVTSGIASAYRDDYGLDYLQFSAPISPGNSGGPVIDERGRVVGVAVAKMIGFGAEGLSFAIPASRLCIALSVC